MRVIRIVLIAFAFAFLAPGDSIPSRYLKAANIYPGLPSDSVKHRPEGATDDFTGTGSYAYDQPSSNTPSWGTLNQISNRKGNSIPSGNPKVADLSSGFPSDSVEHRPEGTTDDFTGTGSYANDEPSSNTLNWISNCKGNSIPSRNPKVADLSSGFPSDSVQHRPKGTTDDFTGTGSYAYDQPSSNTPSWGTLNQISNRKGNSIPSRHLKAATISSGFHSDSVKNRPEGTTDDFTGTGSYANDKPSSNTPFWGTLNGIANGKGNSIPSRNPRAANSSPRFPSDSVEHRPEGDTDDTTGTGSYTRAKPSSNTPSRGTLNGIANHKGNSIPSRNPKVAKYISPQSHSDTVEIRSEGAIDDFSGTGSNTKFKPSTNKPSRGTQNKIARRKGSSIPSRNPKASNISPGFRSDSVEHRPDGTTDDFTGTGSYAKDKPSSNTPSRGTLNGIANRKGNSIPSRNPKVANISPGFHSDTVEIRPEGTQDDFTATDSNDYKPSANALSQGTQNEIASHKGKSIPSRNPEVANISPGFASDSVKHRPEGTKDDFTGTSSFASGKQLSNTAPWGTRKGIVHFGKHVSKKVARLLKSRPNPLASFNKELKDTSDHSFKGNPSVAEGLKPKTETDTVSGPDTDWNSDVPKDKDSEGETDELSGVDTESASDTDWDSGESEDKDSEPDKDKMSGSGTDWDSDKPEDEDSESETDKMSGSNTDLDSGEPDDKHPALEIDEMSRSDTDWDSGEPKDDDSESETDKMSGWNTELDSRKPEDEDSEAEADETSGLDTDWDSGGPEDEDPDSETDKISGSDTDLESGGPDDEDSESESDEMSGSDTDWDSGGPEDEDPDSETDKISGSDTDLESGGPDDEDSESESDEMSGPDTDWDSDKPEDEYSESGTGEIPGSDTDLDSGGPENEDSESHKDGILRSDTDLASVVPENEDSDSETDKMPGSNTELDSGEPDDKNPASEIDEMSGLNTNWGSRKPEEKDSESYTDEMSGSDTDWDSGESEDEDFEAEADEMSGWDSGGPDDEDPDSETDKISVSDTGLDSGGPDDQDSESEGGEMSGSETDWDSGKFEDEASESAKGEIPGSDTDLDSGGPENEDSESHKDGISRLDTDLASGVPENEDSESGTNKMSGSNTELDSGEPVDKNPASKIDEMSGSNANWDSRKPEDEDSESDTNEISGSYTDWDSGESEDENPEAEADEMSGLDTDWDSGGPEDEDPYSKKDKISGSDTDLDSGGPDDEDSESESDEVSKSDTDWASGKPDYQDAESDRDEISLLQTGESDDENPGSGTDKMSGSATDWDSGQPDDKDSESETHEMSGSDIDWDSGVPDEKDSESETEEMSGSDNDWDSGVPDDKDSESETEEMSGSDNDWDFGVPDDEDSESETGEMSGPNTDWESGEPEDKDAESDAHEISGLVTDLDSGEPEDEDPELETDKLSQLDTDLESGEPEDKDSELETDEMSGSDTELESGEPEDEDSESDTDEMSGSDTDLDSGEPEDEDPESEINKMSGSDTGLESVVMKKFASEGKTFETNRANGLPRKISKKVKRMLTWSTRSGFYLGNNYNIRLVSLGNQGVHTKKGKKKRSEKESEGAVIRVLITLFFFGALLVVLMMAAFFAFAWPLRKYYQKLSKQVNNRDMDSWQDDGDELQSIRVDRNQPQQYYTPCQQEFLPVSYQNPVYSTEPAGAHQFMAGNNGDRQAYFQGVVQEYDTSSTRNQCKTKTRDEVISDDKKRDSRNVERRKIIRQQTCQRRDTLTDSLAIAKLIIEGHAKNKDFEKKASERRRVIKHCTSPLKSLTGRKQHPMIFIQELQTGCSVILPSADHQKSMEKSKARRRTIKDHSAGKRRPSLAEEIADAKKVIVDSERKYEISPAQVQEMTVGENSRGLESYSYPDILDLLMLKDKQDTPEASNTKQAGDKSKRFSR